MQDIQPIPRDRLVEYAAREAAQPEAGAFEGGAAAPVVWIGLAVICGLVIVFYSLFVEPNRIRPGT